jgi:hypothetical protein
VAVKIGVGERVAVGVSVGGSGVNVATGEFTTSTGITAPAVWDAPETIVCITAVPRELISWVGAGAGMTQARETINKTDTDKRMGVDFLILPPFGTAITKCGMIRLPHRRPSAAICSGRKMRNACGGL